MNGFNDTKKTAKMVAYAYKRRLVEYTNSGAFSKMFRVTPPDKTKHWKTYLRVASIIKALGTDPDTWVRAQFWARKKFLPGIYPPSVLITKKAVKHFWDYKLRHEQIEEFDTFKRQQIYLDSLKKLYDLPERKVLKLFSGQGIFTEQFYQSKRYKRK